MVINQSTTQKKINNKLKEKGQLRTLHPVVFHQIGVKCVQGFGLVCFSCQMSQKL